MTTFVSAFGLILTLLLPQYSEAQSMRVRILDESNAPIEKALVVIRALETKKEVRGLTDLNGEFRTAVEPGDYQVTGMYPLSWFKDEYTEVRIAHDSTITLKLQASHDQYAYDTQPCSLRILDNGKPVTGASVLIRQRNSDDGQRMYKGSRDGIVAVELLPKGVIVVFAGNKAHHYDAPEKCPVLGLVYDLK